MKAAVDRLLGQCAALRAGENVVIVTDDAADQEIVALFVREIRARQGNVITCRMAPPILPGQEPPATIAAAMRSADLILELTSKFIGSSRARVAACEAGARYLTMPGYAWAILRDDGPFAVDFAEIRPRATKIAERWTAAERYHLTSPAGTDLRGSIAGRKGRVLHGIAAEPGSYMAPPDIEAGLAPVEGSSDGDVVIDGALLFMYDQPLPSPVILKIREGRVTEIEGEYAHYLTEMIDLCRDERMTNLAEVSLGLNPKATINGIPLESEAALGTAHIAMGNSIAYGGTVPAVAHLDLVMRDVTLRLDDAIVIDKGRVLIDGP